MTSTQHSFYSRLSRRNKTGPGRSSFKLPVVASCLCIGAVAQLLRNLTL